MHRYVCAKVISHLVSAAPARPSHNYTRDKRDPTAAIIRRNSARADQRFQIIAQKGYARGYDAEGFTDLPINPLLTT